MRQVDKRDGGCHAANSCLHFLMKGGSAVKTSNKMKWIGGGDSNGKRFCWVVGEWDWIGDYMIVVLINVQLP